MRHVLMINYEYPPLGGGGANATKNILFHLSEESAVKIDLITTSSTGYYYTSRLASNIKIYFLPIKKKNIHYWKQQEIIQFLLKSFIFSRKLIKKKKFHLIHAFFGFPSGFLPFVIRKYPYIISLRGSDVPGFNPRFEIQYLILKPLFRQIWKNAAILTVNSFGLKKLAQDTLKSKKIDIIYNGINVTEFYPKKSYRRDNSEPFTIITVSRLIKRKRIEDLIHAVKILHDENLKVDLTIIGDGKSKQKLEKLTKVLEISSIVRFIGYIPHEQLPQYYTRADVFVLPSMNEGMSNTVLEAISCGLPIILTDVGGTRELMNENGFIVNIKSPQEIAKAIRTLYFDVKLTKEMGVNSRHHAEHFDWNNVSKSYLKLYQKYSQL